MLQIVVLFLGNVIIIIKEIGKIERERETSQRYLIIILNIQK